ncbi:septum formation initiator family protein [Streptococcaceae bacterium ESL0729]|nr:septum formation initiator family protein [Streptococcaceae bacterium ESL0729]
MTKKKKVVRLNNDYTNMQMIKKGKLIRGRLLTRRHMGIILVVFTVLLSFAALNLVSGYQDLRRNIALEKTYEEENNKLTQTIALKEKQVIKLQDDDYVAKYARAKYFYSRDGELIFNIPELISHSNTSKENE